MRQCILVLALFFLSALLSAQSYQGGLRGSVEDPAGSAITIAKVTLKDEATNLSRSTLTNDLGEFVFQSVNPATYSVAIESPGFARLERSGVIIATPLVSGYFFEKTRKSFQVNNIQAIPSGTI